MPQHRGVPILPSSVITISNIETTKCQVPKFKYEFHSYTLG